MITKNIYIKLLLFLILLIFPFSLNTSQNESITLSQESIGYYQSNTCEHSFLSFYLANFNETSIQYNFDTYSTINCFGKVNGIDYVGNSFNVYIGTNIILDLLYQSFIWLFLISLITKNKFLGTKNHLLIPIVCSSLFVLQYFGEEKFYKLYTKNYDSSFNIENFFGLSIFLVYFIIFKLIDEITSNKEGNLFVYFPFIFLFIGTYNSNNINFYILLLSYFGVKNLKNIKFKKNLTKLSVPALFVLVWITTINSNNYFFDPDKLRGFTNSSMNHTSQFFWISIILLTIYGFFCSLNNTKEIDWFKLRLNFLSSGSLIVFFGYLGAKFPIVNFFNFYFFGQNKRGMKTTLSVDGNTWRGFSASAEAVGEYFGFTILFFLIITIYTKKKTQPIEAILIFINLYGLFKTNNFSSSLLLVLFVCILLFVEFTRLDKRYLIAAITVGTASLFYIKLNSLGYSYMSKHLLLEASSYSNLFVGMPDYQNADRFFRENDVGTILLTSDNEERMSNTLRLMIDVFTQDYNIGLIPNPVALLSFISLVINRTRLWGIFIAKYNPDLSHLLFGYGPLQLNEYYFGHETVFIDGLVLPHSSLLDLLLFFGLLGIAIIFYFLIRKIIKNYGNYGNFLIVFLCINFIKSDSILYLSSTLLLLYSIRLCDLIHKDLSMENNG